MAQRNRKRGNGEGSIYLDKARLVYRAAFTLADGKRVSVRAPTRKEASEKLIELQARAHDGLPVGPTDTLGDYIKWWLGVQGDHVGTEADDISPNTFENYCWALRPVIEALSSKRLRELRPHDVETVLTKLARAGKSRRSISRVRTVLAQALDEALRRDEVSRNVARLAKMPKTPPPPKKRSLTLEQAQALLDAAKGSAVEAFVVTGLMTGLRPGELLGLRWVDVDFDAHCLNIRGALKREGTKLRVGGPKTEGSVRKIGMPTPVEVALRAQSKSQTERQLATAPGVWSNSNGLVFTTEVGTPVHPSNMDRKLGKVTAAAGLEGRWSMTELARHSAASLLSAEEVPLEVIADQFGHNNTRMLQAHYRHQLRPNDAHVAVMERLFGQGSGR